MELTEQLENRLKSLLWRSLGMAVVASVAYILQVGDIYKLDIHILINTAAIAFLGLILGEVTKFLNN